MNNGPETAERDRAEARRLLDAAVRHHAAGRLAEASRLYVRVLALLPGQADALNLLGVIRCGEGADGTVPIARALRLVPVASYAMNLAVALERLGRSGRAGEQALAAGRLAVALDPGHAMAQALVGILAARLGRPDAAAACRAALHLDPAGAPLRAELWVALTLALRLEKQTAGTAAAARVAVALDPGQGPAQGVGYTNLGWALLECDRFEAAAGLYRRSILLRPDEAEGYANLGVVRQNQMRLSEALRAYRIAIALQPDLRFAHANHALCLLLTGDFARGWREYLWLLGEAPWAEPHWEGEDVAGRTVLLRPEQGLGDMLQFARFVPLLIARGARVVLEAPPELVRLMRSLDRAVQAIPKGAPLPSCDLQCRFPRLPGLFATTLKTVPAAIPYLRPDPGDVAVWRKRLGEIGGVKVGIAWGGSPHFGNDRRRSAPLAVFAPLSRVPGVRLIAVQKGPPLAQLADPPVGMDILDLSGEIGDFADTAAVAANLDLLIAVDTSVVHMAGATGRPIWVAVPFAPDWRWHAQREDSPWYPTLRLFRQTAPGDWEGVFARIAGELTAFAAARVTLPSAPALRDASGTGA